MELNAFLIATLGGFFVALPLCRYCADWFARSPKWFPGVLALICLGFGVLIVAVLLGAKIVTGTSSSWLSIVISWLSDTLMSRQTGMEILGILFGVEVARAIIGATFGEASPAGGTGTLDTGLSSLMARAFRRPVLCLAPVAALLLAGVTRIDTDIVSIEFATSLNRQEEYIDLTRRLQRYDANERNLSFGMIEKDLKLGLSLYGDRARETQGNFVEMLTQSEEALKQLFVPLSMCVNGMITELNVDPQLLRNASRVFTHELQAYFLRLPSSEGAELGESFRLMVASLERIKGSSELGACSKLVQTTSTNGVSVILSEDMLIWSSPYMAAVISRMMWFNGNIEGVRKFIELVEKENSLLGMNECFSFRAIKAELLQYLGAPASKHIEILNSMLETSKDASEQMQRVEGAGSAEVRELQRWEFSIKHNIAFFLAILGEQQFLARRYATEALEFRPAEPLFLDTYGYVLMSYAALETPPNFEDIERARELFVESLARVQLIENERIKRTQIEIVNDHIAQANFLLLQRN